MHEGPLHVSGRNYRISRTKDRKGNPEASIADDKGRELFIVPKDRAEDRDILKALIQAYRAGQIDGLENGRQQTMQTISAALGVKFTDL